jgi:CrcB protein
MIKVLAVLIGGGFGAMFRHFVTDYFKRHHYHNKQNGTLLVNIVGSFLLGLAVSSSIEHNSILYKLLVIGFIASFTTYSSFEFDNLTLIASQRYKEFFRYSIGSCLICLFCLTLGIMLFRVF